MKYSTFFIIVVFFILLLAVGCTSPSSLPQETKTVPLGVSADSLEYETYQVCIDACPSQCLNDLYYTVARQKEDANYCDKIESVSLREECKNQLLGIEAVSDLSKEKCLMIADENEQQSCLTHVAAEAAVQANDVTKCDEAPDVQNCQDLYYRDTAFATKDVTYCDMLSDEEDTTRCVEAVGQLE